MGGGGVGGVEGLRIFGFFIKVNTKTYQTMTFFEQLHPWSFQNLIIFNAWGCSLACRLFIFLITDNKNHKRLLQKKVEAEMRNVESKEKGVEIRHKWWWIELFPGTVMYPSAKEQSRF